MSAHEIIFTNAAIQNREFSLDEKPYKAIGILAARVLNTLYGSNTPEVHCWNNAGAFHETVSTTPTERLTQKYDSNFAQHYLASQSSDYRVLTDDETEFSLWARVVLEEMLHAGTVYEDTAEFIACAQCGSIIAESVVNVGTCSKCNDARHLHTQQAHAFFTDTPPTPELLPREKLFNRINVQHELETLRQTPHRLLLSRTRQIGIPLDEFGMKGMKLDPRLGIGLLALYSAQQYDYEQVGITQSISTLSRIAPYLASAAPDTQQLGIPDYVYAFHGKVQPDLLSNPALHPQVLALYSLGQRSDITTKVAEGINREIENLSRRLEIVTRICKDRQMPITATPLSTQNVTNISLTGIIAQTNKELGRSLETMKHNKIAEKDELDRVSDNLATANTVQHALGGHR